MKKGQIYEGIIERVDFPNKGIVFVPEEEQYVIVKNEMQKEDFLKCWRNLHWRQGSRSAVSFLPVVAVCIRQCHTKNR